MYRDYKEIVTKRQMAGADVSFNNGVIICQIVNTTLNLYSVMGPFTSYTFRNHIGTWDVSMGFKFFKAMDDVSNNYFVGVFDSSGQTVKYLNDTGAPLQGVNNALSNLFSQSFVWSAKNLPYTGTLPTLTVSVPASNTCFPAGTPVKTDQGVIFIEDLHPNQHTIDGKTIVAITKTILQDRTVICFEKDSISKNVPSIRTIMSRNHRILHDGLMSKAKEYCKRYQHTRKVYEVTYNNELLYNVLLEEHGNMVINNMVCETLHPKNTLAKLYQVIDMLSPVDQKKLIKEYNKIYKKLNSCKSIN